MSFRIVHADRHKLFHDALKRVLSDNENFEFIDHCTTLKDSLESLERNKPDMLLTSTILYDSRYVVDDFCDYRDLYNLQMKIVVLTMVGRLDHLLNGLIRQVHGYVYKWFTSEEVYKCILDVYKGDNHLTIGDYIEKKYKK